MDGTILPCLFSSLSCFNLITRFCVFKALFVLRWFSMGWKCIGVGFPPKGPLTVVRPFFQHNVNCISFRVSAQWRISAWGDPLGSSSGCQCVCLCRWRRGRGHPLRLSPSMSFISWPSPLATAFPPPLSPLGWPECHRRKRWMEEGWGSRIAAAVSPALWPSPLLRWSSSTPCGSLLSAAWCCRTTDVDPSSSL